MCFLGLTWSLVGDVVDPPGAFAATTVVGPWVYSCGGGSVENDLSDVNRCLRWRLSTLNWLRLTTDFETPQPLIEPTFRQGMIYQYTVNVKSSKMNLTISTTTASTSASLYQLNNGTIYPLFHLQPTRLNLKLGTNLLVVTTLDGPYTFQILYTSPETCSIDTVKNIPVGGNYSKTCSTGSVLIGEVSHCMYEGTFNLVQDCVLSSSKPWTSTLVSNIPSRMGVSMTVCSDTNHLFMIGGQLSTTTLSDEVWRSQDAGITWSKMTSLPEARNGASVICNAAGHLHVLFGSSLTTTLRSTNGGISWTGPFPAPAGSPDRTYGHAVLIPSSGGYDFLYASGNLLDTNVLRWSHLRSSWSYTGATIPGLIGYRMAYVGSKLIIAGGRKSGDVLSNGTQHKQT